MPQIVIDFPEEDEEREILRAQVTYADDEVLEYVVGFLRAAHLADLRYTVRDGINVLRYALKRLDGDLDSDAITAFNASLELALGAEEAEPFLLT
jgi:hypothetical protein